MRSTIRIAIITATASAVLVALYTVWSSIRQPPPAAVVSNGFAARENPIDQKQPSGRYMFNVTLHTLDEIAGMLRRADELAAREPAVQPETGIALVLHGPEIKLFTKASYSTNKTLVDLAKRLDENGVIEVKMCQTAMRDLGVKEEDVPGFISFVPYAPDEIKRLEAEGYVYL